MRKILKYLVVCFFAIVILIPSVSATSNANSLAELRKELSGLKQKKITTENKKRKTETQIQQAKDNIYNSQISINKNRDNIEQAKIDIAKLNIEISKTEESIKNMIMTYEIIKGDNIYLDFIFNAKSYSDLVYRYAMISQMVDYSKEQVEDWSAKIIYNQQLQKDLAQEEIELNRKIKELEDNIEDFGDQLDQYSEITMDIDDEIKSTDATIKMFESLGCKETENLDKCLENAGVLIDTKFRKPLPKGVITSYYGYRTHPVTGKVESFHSGVDIGGNSEGTKIYSTANGIVGKIISYNGKNICGGQQVYIYHMINGVQYTSAYLHLLTINVKLGQYITYNTVIGTVGGGKGTSKYETCSTGAHLHFTLAKGWYGKTYVNYSTFLANTFNPKATLNLPNKGTYWFSR